MEIEENQGYVTLLAGFRRFLEKISKLNTLQVAFSPSNLEKLLGLNTGELGDGPPSDKTGVYCPVPPFSKVAMLEEFGILHLSFC